MIGQLVYRPLNRQLKYLRHCFITDHITLTLLAVNGRNSTAPRRFIERNMGMMQDALLYRICSAISRTVGDMPASFCALIKSYNSACRFVKPIIFPPAVFFVSRTGLSN
jgi:hypothetical protein